MATDLLRQLDQLGELVVDLGAELRILLGKVLHELGVARRDLGAQLGVPAFSLYFVTVLNYLQGCGAAAAFCLEPQTLPGGSAPAPTPALAPDSFLMI